MGSADWMPRNLDRRVEIVFPVEDERIKNEIKHVLDLEFRDNVKAHILQPDGTYEKTDKTRKAADQFPDGILQGGHRESRSVKEKRKT